MDEYEHLRESADAAAMDRETLAAFLAPAAAKEPCHMPECQRVCFPGHAYCADHEARWLAQAFGTPHE